MRKYIFFLTFLCVQTFEHQKWIIPCTNLTNVHLAFCYCDLKVLMIFYDAKLFVTLNIIFYSNNHIHTV